jgi:F-type H+-transporting ATPase subunit gamma
MPTLLDYRRRIRSVKSTQQITRAMKFVAAAKLRRAQEAVYQARPYAKEILRVLRSAAARMESPAHPLLERREEKKILILLVTGDRSLAGAFNTNVLRHATEFIRSHQVEKIEMITVGRKGRDYFKRRGQALLADYIDISASLDIGKAREIAHRIADLYISGEVDAVYAVYNEFKNVMVQNLRAAKLLPIDPAVVKTSAEGDLVLTDDPAAEAKDLPTEQASDGKSRLIDYIYEQPVEQIFAGLLPRYLQSEIYRVLLESSAAEHAARMTAMDSATRNAADLIKKLTLQMNKIRQAAITTEIIEIVSGASSAQS